MLPRYHKIAHFGEFFLRLLYVYDMKTKAQLLYRELVKCIIKLSSLADIFLSEIYYFNIRTKTMKHGVNFSHKTRGTFI